MSFKYTFKRVMTPNHEYPTGRANIINFIRYDHGMDTVENEMREILRRDLPCTWLLQYDALVDGAYVDFLKTHATASHEIGLWFEVNRRHCVDAGVPFRGENYAADHEPDTLNWDHRSRAMMSCGYNRPERIRLIDTMMERFRGIFGSHPKSVAAWYIDSFSLDYLKDRFQIVASANCRDSWGTDGYTFWGAPLHAFYYPSQTNAMAVGETSETQIHLPVFRMLNVDPVDAHDISLCGNGQAVLTLEPAYPDCGGDPKWIENYFDLMGNGRTRPFAYFQVGQENGFEWNRIARGFCAQLDTLVQRRDRGELVVETLADTGRFCLEQWAQTPVGILHGDRSPSGTARRSLWYHSRKYRLGLEYSEDGLFLNSLDLYSKWDQESHFSEPLNTYSSAFGALHAIDSFVFSSCLALCGTHATGEPFDERDCPLRDVRVIVEGDTAVLTYRNSLGVSSCLRFDPDGIEIIREIPEGVTCKETLIYDRFSRFQTLQGIFENQLVFGWRNQSFRVVAENVRRISQFPDDGQVVLMTSSSGTSRLRLGFRTEPPHKPDSPD